MKLAEALLLRADLQKKLQSLRERIVTAALAERDALVLRHSIILAAAEKLF